MTRCVQHAERGVRFMTQESITRVSFDELNDTMHPAAVLVHLYVVAAYFSSRPVSPDSY